jgi:predicted RNA-binding Zn ribbon-like protein
VVTVAESADQGAGAAPGPLALVQSLANTLGAAPVGDLLATREQAVPWLRGAGLMPADAAITNSEYGALLRLREALRDALASHASGATAASTAAGGTADAAARLTKGLADGRLVTTITPDGAVKLATAARSVYPSIVAAIAVAIAESAAAGTWPRLWLCQDPDCGRAFYAAAGQQAAAKCPAHGGTPA